MSAPQRAEVAEVAEGADRFPAQMDRRGFGALLLGGLAALAIPANEASAQTAASVSNIRPDKYLPEKDRAFYVSELHRLIKGNAEIKRQVKNAVHGSVVMGTNKGLDNPDGTPIMYLDPASKEPVINIQRDQLLAVLVNTMLNLEERTAKLLKQDAQVLAQPSPAAAAEMAREKALKLLAGFRITAVQGTGEIQLLGLLASTKLLPQNELTLLPPRPPVGAGVPVAERKPR